MIIIALTINYFPFLIICVIVNLCVINFYMHSVSTSASDRICYKSKNKYQTAIDFAKRKRKTDTDMSVPETGRNKRRVKKKSQNDYTSDFSDNSQSHGMTPPPMLSAVFDTLVVYY